MMTTKIIIAADSRGRHLQQYIHQHSIFNNFTVICIPGAKINTLKHAIKQNTKDIHPLNASITLLAGICNLTEKIHHTQGTQITYNHSQQKTDTIIQQLQDISTSFNTSTSTLKIATIPPASQKKYALSQTQKKQLKHSIFTDTELNSKQKTLEEDITYINTVIANINTNNNLTTIRWDRDVQKVTIKKRGVHCQNAKKNNKKILLLSHV